MCQYLFATLFASVIVFRIISEFRDFRHTRGSRWGVLSGLFIKTKPIIHLKVRKVAKNLIIHYSLFFFQFIKKVGLFITLKAVIIHYLLLFFAH